MARTGCEQCGKIDRLEDGLCPRCRTANTPTLAPSSTSQSPTSATFNPVELPQDFGEYQLLEEIARGGMGVVYKARHQRLNRVAALKMILSGRFSSEEELRRFHIEAESAARLDHPGIVPVYEIGEVDGQPFFAMKFIEGGSLAEHMQYLQDDPNGAMRLLGKVARAVHHAHQRGVLHRDLKPGNILMSADGEPLITDLGLAKNTTNDSGLTNTGAVMGTPSYMSPEQASGGAVTTASDIYSLGAIMYQLLTGEPPHQGDTALETVMNVIKGPPAAPSSKAKNVDRSLEAICMKCLEHDAETRYSSALQLADDLEAWANGESISVRSPSVLTRVSRWMKQNTRLVYSAFTIVAGIVVTLPFALAILLTPDAFHREVYARFPADETPLIFTFQSSIPVWMSILAIVLLVMVFYPTIGYINAIVTRSSSLWHSVVNGAVTAMILGVLFVGFVGWIPMAGEMTDESTPVIQALGNVVWTPDGMSQEKALEKANTLFKGLDKIPVEERSELVAKRVRSDQFYEALTTVIELLMVFVFLSVPIVVGTVLAHVIMRRGSRWWVSYLRYYIAWWLAISACFFSIGYFVTGPQVNGRPLQEQPWLAVRVIGTTLTLLYLVLRRWRKKSGVAEPPSTSLIEPTLPLQPN